jgi:hypothetical protein
MAICIYQLKAKGNGLFKLPGFFGKTINPLDYLDELIEGNTPEELYEFFLQLSEENPDVRKVGVRWRYSLEKGWWIADTETHYWRTTDPYAEVVVRGIPGYLPEKVRMETEHSAYKFYVLKREQEQALQHSLLDQE